MTKHIKVMSSNVDDALKELILETVPTNYAFTAETMVKKIRKKKSSLRVRKKAMEVLLTRLSRETDSGIVELSPLKDGGEPRYRVTVDKGFPMENSVSHVIHVMEQKKAKGELTVKDIAMEKDPEQTVRVSIDILSALGVINVTDRKHAIRFQWNDKQAEVLRKTPELMKKYKALCDEIQQNRKIVNDNENCGEDGKT